VDRGLIWKTLNSFFPEGRVRGDEYHHLCPFHNDGNLGNCSTNLLTGKGHCFACSARWNLASLYAKKLGVSYDEARRELATEASPCASANGDPLEIALETYRKNYRTRSKAGDYAAARGLLSSTVEQFEIGYAMDSWTDLADRITGTSRERALELKLLKRSETRGNVYDFLRNRLIFPIRSEEGSLVGFAGRDLNNEEPAYLNTVFQKRKVLYGLHETRSRIKEAGKGVLVEGYLDFLVCWQNHVQNVCATMGTALTAEHVCLLKDQAASWTICFDGDQAGREANDRAAGLLAAAGLKVSVAELPETEDPASLPPESLRACLEKANPWKGGSEGNSLTGASKKKNKEPRPIQAEGPVRFSKSNSYAESNNCLYTTAVHKDSGELFLAQRLCNWTAGIREDLTVDNGLEPLRVYRIEASKGSRKKVMSVKSSEFMRTSNWVWYTDALGPTATVNPNVRGVEKHVRTAIQEFSRPKEVKQYAYTGWVKTKGRWEYLCPGLSEDVDLDLTGLKLPYHLLSDPDPGSIEMIPVFLRVANPEVTSVLLASVFLAPLVSFFSNPSIGFSVYLHGPSGSRKTTLALAALCFYGDFTGQQKLLSFDDTSNSLEAHLHSLKDILALVDDLRPGASLQDDRRLEKTAKNIIHAIGNRSGRNRMNPDATLKPQRYPRGFILMTGERIPSGTSTIARLFPVEITDMNLECLTGLQRKAPSLKNLGSLYVKWLRNRMETLVPELKEVFVTYRAQLQDSLEHGRWAENTAFLKIGLLAGTQFLEDLGLPDAGELLDLSSHFEAQAERNRNILTEQTPAERFLRALRDLIHTDRIFIQGLSGADCLGSPQGPLIGFVDPEFLYLYPGSAYHAASMYYRDEQGPPLPPSRALMQDLQAQGYIKNHKAKKVKGKSVRLLWLNPAVLHDVDENL
jgi:DNA primase catalytic core